jgi:hypothetical protein
MKRARNVARCLAAAAMLAALPAVAAAQGESGEPKKEPGKGKTDKVEVKEAPADVAKKAKSEVEGREGAVQRCYEKLKAEDCNCTKKMEVNVSVAYVINPNGEAAGQTINVSGVRNPDKMKSCVREALSGVRFPAFEGKELRFTTSFNFKKEAEK